jgi:hypothetical protein
MWIYQVEFSARFKKLGLDQHQFARRRRLSESFEEAYHAGAEAGIVFSVIGQVLAFCL